MSLLPAPGMGGARVLGDSFVTIPGGKGANQAVAAARLGAVLVPLNTRYKGAEAADILEIPIGRFVLNVAKARGFDTYLDYPGWGSWNEGRSPKAENLNAVTIPELDELVKGDAPFFLFLRHRLHHWGA